MQSGSESCVQHDAPWVLVLFTRWPEPGRTKTRLIPQFGADGAARIHRAMIIRTAHAAEGVTPPAEVLVALADAPTSANVTELFGNAWPTVQQSGDDLGERMANAFDAAFLKWPAADRAVLVGVDCPPYSSALFSEAAAALRSHECVFAPTEDGGYGLVGVTRRAWTASMRAAIFSGVEWGTARVMRQTLDRLADISSRETSRSTVALLDQIWDIDTPDDVRRAVNEGYVRPEDV